MKGKMKGELTRAMPVHPTGRALPCRGRFNAARRERRRPAEASPLCETRRWTRLFRKFTVAARERQAATRGPAPLAPRPPLDAADLGHSPRCAVPACARGRQP